LTQGRWWSGEELDAIAKGWLTAVRERARGDRLVAVAVPTSPEGVALVIALSALPSPVILLSPDVRAWRSAPMIPVGTPLVLPPALAQLAPDPDPPTGSAASSGNAGSVPTTDPVGATTVPAPTAKPGPSM